MYQYTEFDRKFVSQRAAQYRDQLERHLAGQLGDDEFRPLRLQNGWYIQRYAPMLRIAVPYGEIASRQLRVPIVPFRSCSAWPRNALTSLAERSTSVALVPGGQIRRPLIDGRADAGRRGAAEWFT